ncbi:MAG: hypothetical protein Q8859_05140 [Bacteroidota bacterium]|nr:hypothetical protein [Bacteroidota bacterium]
MKKIILFLFVFCASLIAKSQDLTVFNFMNDVKNAKYQEGVLNGTVHNYNGSPFLSDEFKSGEIETVKGLIYKGLDLRFNIYQDQVEFKQDKRAYMVPKDNFIKSAKIGEDIFILASVGQNKASTYYRKITNGKVTLLEKYNVAYNEAQKRVAYSDPKPAEYVRQSNDYYLLIATDGFAHKISGVKSINELFPLKENEIKDFLKKNKLGVKKEADLIRVAEFLSSF